MSEGNEIIWQAGCVLATVGWGLKGLFERRRVARLGRALDMLSEQGNVQAALAVAGVDSIHAALLSKLTKLGAVQDEMRQRIEHEEFSLRTVLSSMEEGVLVADERQKIRLANPAFSAVFGLQKSPVEQSVLEVLREPDVHRLLQEVLRSGDAMERQLEMMPGKRSRFITVRAVPMSDVRGRPGVLAVVWDVTRLMELEQVRREFVANVSHELRTPLAIFQGYVENLIDIPDLPETERNLVYTIILKHSKRLNALVEDLLAIARLEARKEKFRWERLEPGELIRDLVDDWKVRTVGAAMAVSVEAPEVLPLVRIDRMRMEQVLHNLLENAFKHSPAAGGRVLVRAFLEADAWVRVSVEDNGSGIAQRDLPHIFERFYRADKARGGASTRGAAHSTGLGLSIVKHIVAGHGGEVGAESAHGSGAKVWFRLPVSKESDEALNPTAGQPWR